MSDKNDIKTVEIKAYGSHHDIGYTIGRFHKKSACRIFNNHFEDTIVRFYETKNGKAICDKLLENSKKLYPHLIQELQGLADGMGQDFMKVFLYHAKDEIYILQRTKWHRWKNVFKLDFEPELHHSSDESNNEDMDSVLIYDDEVFPSDGCSTLYLHTNDSCAVVHNEDLPRELARTGVFVEAHVYPDPNATRKESFYAYSQPGLLPGKGPAFNMHGLAMCSNTVLPRNLNAHGVPSRIVLRAMLAAKNFDEAVQLATKDCSSGLSISLTQNQKGHKDTINIEVYPTEEEPQYNVYRMTDFDFHFNEYKNCDTKYLTDHSSQGRLMALQSILSEFGKPRDVEDLLHILAYENTDDTFPLYRSGLYPDDQSTAITVWFDLHSGMMEAFNHPKDSFPAIRKPLIYLAHTRLS